MQNGTALILTVNLLPLPNERTRTFGGSITVQLVASFTSLDSSASLHTNTKIFFFLVCASLLKLETSHTVILPQTVSHGALY